MSILLPPEAQVGGAPPHASAAAATFRTCLERDLEASSAIVRASWDRLTAEGRPLCTALEPVFVDASEIDAIRSDLASLVDTMAAIARNGTILRNDPRASYLRAPGRARLPWFSRIDGLLSSNGLKVIELNALFHDVIPWGVGIVDAAHDLFVSTPAMQEVLRRFRVRESTTLRAAVDAFSILRTTRQDARGPTVAVVDVSCDGEHLPIDPDARYGLMLAQTLAAQGADVFYGRASAFTYEGGRLRHEDRVVDVILGAGGDATLESGLGVLVLGREHPLLRALADGAVAACDAFPLGGLLGDKALLARVYEAATTGRLAPAVADVVRRLVPWTAELRPGETTFRGERRDLADVLATHRCDLVVKPSWGFGGRGVFLGWEHDADGWSRVVSQALEKGAHVVQERVRLRQEDAWMLRDGAPALLPVRSDLCPYVWSDGSVSGAMVRTSLDDRLNITGGATMRPLFVVEGLA